MKDIVSGEILNKNKETEIVKNIVFKSTSYDRTYDFDLEYDSYVKTILGYINYIQVNVHRPTMPIGEYMYNVFNVALAKINRVNFMNLLNSYCETNEIYVDLIDLLKSNKIDVNQYNKIVYIPTIILNEKFRNKNVVSEFIKYIKREFYGENVLILFLVKPFQQIEDDFNYFCSERTIEIKSYHKCCDLEEFEANVREINNKSKHTITIYKIPALRYYNLNGEMFNIDHEISQYKLYAHAQKLGLIKIDDGNIFKIEE